MNIRRTLTRYPTGTRVVQFSTNRPGEVVAVLSRGQRLIMATGSGRNQDRRLAQIVPTRDLRREVDYR
jgi:hypothetical protein